LQREIAAKKRRFGIETWETVYIGGGTPSLIPPHLIASLAAPLADSCTEFTVEANPEDITEDWLAACADSGISRLSIGIQSMDDAVLGAVGRRGNGESNRRALERVSTQWKGRVSYDLIAALPGQNADMLAADIELLDAYNATHISLYSLTVEDGTPIAGMIGNGVFSPGQPCALPDEDESADIWIAGRDLLEQKGFAQYEVSNFAKSGFESKHNMTYWNLDSWIGAGPGASGTIRTNDTAIRQTGPTDIEQWLQTPEASCIEETLNREECIRESILMGMRMRSGIDKDRFRKRFGPDIAALIPRTTEKWRRNGFLVENETRYALTREGLLHLNAFLADCMREL
jgi:oxygen-independent coproporphyrinogen III oxidase